NATVVDATFANKTSIPNLVLVSTTAGAQSVTLGANSEGAIALTKVDASAAIAGNSVTINASGRATAITILGGAGNDTLTGGAGADTITGGNGNNVITGGGGADILAGGSGDDQFVIGALADINGL